MFQLAAAYALAFEHQVKVGINLDKIRVKNNADYFTKREFELNKIFNLVNSELVEKKEFKYIVDTKKSFWHSIKYKLQKSSFFYEKTLEYEESFWTLSGNALIEGYFQSEKYFKKYELEIRKLFEFKNVLNDRTLNLTNQIAHFNSVAIHVRRGDYISVKQNLQTHGVCSTEYYIQAHQRFKDIQNIRFIVLSDDIPWCIENLNLSENTIFVDWNNGPDSWQDMYIISKCNHAIIANSSFSWWGAWLINKPNKKIIAPNQWFNDHDKQKQTKDLIPSSWIKI